MVEFSNRKQDAGKRWFKEQSPQVRSLVAYRAALRVIPNTFLYNESTFTRLALGAFWAILVSAHHSKEPGFEHHNAEGLSRMISRWKEVDGDDDSRYRAGQAALFSAARSAQFVSGYAADGVFEALWSVQFAFRDDSLVSRLASRISSDAKKAERSEKLDPLWERHFYPKPIEATHQKFVLALASDERWRFFHDWYLGMWDGTWTDWDLAFEVAKIEADVWEAGLDAVAARIREIEAKHDVIRKLGEIPRDTTVADRHGIGGNSPPESLDEIESVTANAIVIWSGVEALDAETKAETPSAERVKAAINLLTKGLGACVAWLGRKGDLATDETIKALAKWGAPIGGAYYLANPSQLQALIDTAKNWVAFLQ